MPTLLLTCGTAAAMPIETDSDVRLDWNNTFQVTLIDQPGTVSYGPYGRCLPGSYDGFGGAQQHCAARSGLVSSRFDWLSQVTLNYRDVGVEVSSAAWYDPAYESWKRQDHTSAASMAAPSYFTQGGHDPVGDIELWDAVVYGTTDLGTDQPLTVRLGRQVALWGESLYFVENGIAGAQAPIDTYRYPVSGDYQASPVFLPVGQGSFSWQPTSELALLGYYQFEWRRSRISPYDAYDDTATMLENEYTRQIALPIRGGGAIAYDRTADLAPGSFGQFGLGARYHGGDFDWGLYALRFDAKEPELYFGAPSGSPAAGSYTLAYPEGIEAYGVSLAGPLGDASFGAELSARRRMPLVNAGILLAPGQLADNDAHPAYPVGDTLHGQFSFDYATPPLPGVPGGANWTAELAFNDLLATTANADALLPGRTRFASALRTVFEPQFFQILPRLDLSLPIGLGYNLIGRSETDPTMNHGTGDVTIGAALTFDQRWKVALSATHYFGDTGNAYLPLYGVAVKHALSDQDFLLLSLARSF